MPSETTSGSEQLDSEPPQRDLDPRNPEEWQAVRRAGYRLVDQLVLRHQQLRDEPCWRAMPAELRAALQQEPPRDGLGIEAALARAERLIEPFGTGNLHPRFWGWVLGAGNLPGILGQWLASAMNANVFAGDQGPVQLELAVLAWFRRWFEFPESSSGILLDGASMANILALAVARHAASSGHVKQHGLSGQPAMRVYASTATHNSLTKAAELLGLGTDALCLLAADGDGRADVSALERAIAYDRGRGLQPFCVVGNAGTVGTGALDPLPELRALADRHGLWFHVDAAIGGLSQLSARLRPRVAGIERADSLSFDLHKWGQVPYDAGCLLVRDGQLHRDTFAASADYLSALSGGLMPHGSHAFNALSPQLSRADRALKIWMTFMALGSDRLVAVFEDNVAQAEYLAQRIACERELELMAKVSLNIVCLRYRAAPLAMDALNERILVELQSSGFCVVSPYRIAGQLCLRVAISNHRTRCEDLAAFVARVLELGRRFGRSP
jgi:aromatic-L-amino-acid/L-tryptophan decarboxylase